jgi:hypothetical protein
MMRCIIGLGLIAALTGCATSPCSLPWSKDACRETRLLQANDLLQAKMLIAAADPYEYPLAHALLNRAAPHDETGEAEFYRAVLLIRQEGTPADVIRHLERAANKRHPHAVALLYKVYSDPYLVDQPDTEKANHYREMYGQLNVAKGGYPSFERALNLVTRLVEVPPQG